MAAAADGGAPRQYQRVNEQLLPGGDPQIDGEIEQEALPEVEGLSEAQQQKIAFVVLGILTLLIGAAFLAGGITVVSLAEAAIVKDAAGVVVSGGGALVAAILGLVLVAAPIFRGCCLGAGHAFNKASSIVDYQSAETRESIREKVREIETSCQRERFFKKYPEKDLRYWGVYSEESLASIKSKGRLIDLADAATLAAIEREALAVNDDESLKRFVRKYQRPFLQPYELPYWNEELTIEYASFFSRLSFHAQDKLKREWISVKR